MSSDFQFYAAATFLITEPLIAIVGPFTQLKRLIMVNFAKTQE